MMPRQPCPAHSAHVGKMGYQVSDAAFPAADIPPTNALGRGGREGGCMCVEGQVPQDVPLLRSPHVVEMSWIPLVLLQPEWLRTTPTGALTVLGAGV